MHGRLTSKLLATTHPDGLIEQWAEEHEVFQPKRKVDIVVFVWTLILGFPAGAKRTLASLRRRFEKAAGISIARTAFHDRFTPELATMMRRLVDWCLETKSTTYAKIWPRKWRVFGRFWRSIRRSSISTRCSRRRGRRPTRGSGCQNAFHSERRHQRSRLRKGNGPVHAGCRSAEAAGPWVAVCLLTGDLGYYHFDLFHRIDQQDDYFLSPLRDDANPLLVESHQTTPGNSIDLAGNRLDDVLDRLRRQKIDVTIELDVQLQKHRGTSSWRRRRFRMVGLRDDDAGEYRLFFTNISR